MKQKLKIIIPITLILLVTFMGYKIFAILKQKDKIAAQIQSMPPFAFTNTSTGSIYTDANLQPNISSLIIYFHPDCEYCQEQAAGINKQIDDFNNFQLLFISHADSAAIKSFSNKYGLSGHQNIVFLEDKDLIFKSIFGKTPVPSSFIYNKQGKLVKQFKGEAKIEDLLKYLNL